MDKGDANLVCQECGFVPKHVCQIDIVHIDGIEGTDDPGKYETWCANCQMRHVGGETWEQTRGQMK